MSSRKGGISDDMLEDMFVTIEEYDPDTHEPDEAEVFEREATKRDNAVFDDPIVEELADSEDENDIRGVSRRPVKARRVHKKKSAMALAKTKHTSAAERRAKASRELARDLLEPAASQALFARVQQQTANTSGTEREARKLAASIRAAADKTDAFLKSGDTTNAAAAVELLREQAATIAAMAERQRLCDRRIRALAERTAANSAQCAAVTEYTARTAGHTAPIQTRALAESDANGVMVAMAGADGNANRVDETEHPLYAIRIGARGEVAIGTSVDEAPTIIRTGRPAGEFLATSTAREGGTPITASAGLRRGTLATRNGNRRRIARTRTRLMQGVQKLATPLIGSAGAALAQKRLGAPTSSAVVRKR